jgi:hypothetical protein
LIDVFDLMSIVLLNLICTEWTKDWISFQNSRSIH